MKTIKNNNLRVSSCVQAGLSLIVLLVWSHSLMAAPTVEGRTISWPDDGWYQVQNADDFSSLCDGGRSCEVAPGVYLVINHTTGERFEGIVVAGETGGSTNNSNTIEPGAGTNSIRVVGNTIQWPDDGWYQVQDSLNYNSICEGGLACDVANGTYTVINHTSGERFNDIIVGGESSGNSNSVESTTSVNSIRVVGNTIQWPDDGWYQIQDAFTYNTLCEGGTACDVAHGQYIVINHTSGLRVDNVVVGTPSFSPESVLGAVATNEPEVSWSNSEMLIRQALEIFTAKAYDTRLDQALRTDNELQNGLHITANSGLSLIDEEYAADRSQVFNNLLSRTVACSNGGTAIQTSDPVSSFGDTFKTIVYDNCLINGEVKNGIAQLRSRFPGIHRYEFDNYSVTFEPTGQMTLNGELTLNRDTRAAGIALTAENVTSTLDYDFEYPGGILRVSNSDAFYGFSRNQILPDVWINRVINESSSFQMQPPFSDNTFRVSIAETMQSNGRESGDYFDTGSMVITSTSDDSSLTLNAGTGDFQTFSLVLQQNGDESTPTQFQWSTLADVLCHRQITSSLLPESCSE